MSATDQTQMTALAQASSAAHPVPDQSGMDGATEIVRMAQSATADDLVIALINHAKSKRAAP